MHESELHAFHIDLLQGYKSGMTGPSSCSETAAGCQSSSQYGYCVELPEVIIILIILMNSRGWTVEACLRKGQSAMLMAAVNDLPGVAKALIVGNADVNQARTMGLPFLGQFMACQKLSCRPMARVKAHYLFQKRTASERLYQPQVCCDTSLPYLRQFQTLRPTF